MIGHLDNRNLDNQYFILFYLIGSERKLFINYNEIIEFINLK